MSLIEQYITAVATYAEAAELPRQVVADLARAANNVIRLSGDFYRLHHDHETYCDLSIKDVGADAYSRHPSTEILMTAYAVNDNDVLQWLPAEGEYMPTDLREMLADPKCIKFAWNKPFEWSIWANTMGIETPHEEWRDPMVVAFSLSLPGSLEKAGEVVGIDEDKQKLKQGKALIREFCMPRKPTKSKPWLRSLPHHEPEKWEIFKYYNRNDVEAERAIWKKIVPFNMPANEWRMWFLDQKINQRGIPINMHFVDKAIGLYEHVIEDRIARLKEITGLDKPTSPKAFLAWIRQFGYPFEDLKKGHVARALAKLQAQFKAGEFEDNADEKAEMEAVLEALALREEVAAASPKKYYALRRSCASDDTEEGGFVLRNAFQFAGAGRTWRWAGRMFQAQNLPRPDKKLEKKIDRHVKNLTALTPIEIEELYPKPMVLLKSCIRPAAQAPATTLFIDADLNAIENRVLGWVAGCEKILRVFKENRDPYIDFATYLFGGNYADLFAEWKAGDSTKRTVAKPGVLGCGYMLGAGKEIYNRKTGEIEATGLLGYAWDMGIREFTADQSTLSVETFRREFSEVKDYWYAIERAAKRCIKTGKPVKCGFVEFDMKPPFMRMILPSGRALHYCRPRIEMIKAPWGDMKETITYEGLNDKNQWTRISTHPGKLTENAVQAIARDLIAHAMLLADKKDIDIRIHVHDQIVGLSPEEKAKRQLEILMECMGVVPSWAPGLPLGSAGFSSPIFIKD